MLNPFQKAVLRIAQGHYGGAPKASWLQRMAQYQDMQNPVGQRMLGTLGMSDPNSIMSLTPSQPFLGAQHYLAP
jgi:hypothetical protein